MTRKHKKWTVSELAELFRSYDIRAFGPVFTNPVQGAVIGPVQQGLAKEGAKR